MICFILFLLQVVFETLYLIERYFPFRWPMSGVWKKKKESFVKWELAFRCYEIPIRRQSRSVRYRTCSTCAISLLSLSCSPQTLRMRLQKKDCVFSETQGQLGERKLIKNNQLDKMSGNFVELITTIFTSPPCCPFSYLLAPWVFKNGMQQSVR